MPLRYGDNLKPELSVYSDGIKTGVEVKQESGGFKFRYEAVKGNFKFYETANGFSYVIEAENTGACDFAPGQLVLDMGVDTYMESYPEWNEKYFPSFFRCEKSHFYGYFMRPDGKMLGVFCGSPAASYSLEYNKPDINSYGHRIKTAQLVLLSSLRQPYHHPENCRVIRPGEKKNYIINFEYCKSREEWAELLTEKYGFPYITAEKFTVEKNEIIKPTVKSKSLYNIIFTAPCGRKTDCFKAEEYGLYRLEITNRAGYSATAAFYCRKPFEQYMKAAREAAVSCPPHATTHCESWYGLFSAFAAAKHYPDAGTDKTAENMFRQIMPYMFDFENARPKLLTERIQNVSALISLLVDHYELDEKRNYRSLLYASKFADWLITRQHSNGGYYRNETLYTCVIYPAKSMLELYFAEKRAGERDGYFKEAAQRHYRSASLAVQDITERLENIQTEGEQTLEDGMLSCAALQIAMYALTLPPEKRGKYIKAAEHMISVHRCLEQLENPDCRMRNATIRYWETQYDVLILRNLQTSPHGWSAWLSYALYYLYLLTGKKNYLTELMNLTGACIQLISDTGELRWGFATDPCVIAESCACPDYTKPVRGVFGDVGYREKFEKRIIGEEYISMISGWFKTADTQPVTGGHYWCPLFTETETVEVDKQGGCCDNDVHEIFKCLEETVLKRAFIYQNGDGTLLCYNCRAFSENGKITLVKTEDIDKVCINLKKSAVLETEHKSRECGVGITEITL